jgi:5-methylcytosine-specific restriction endonuclease McrA
MNSITKKCSKCGLVRNKDSFVKDKNQKDKLSLWCKECYKNSRKKWYAENIERERKKSREKMHTKFISNPSAFIEKVRNWKNKNKEKVSKSNKQWRENNSNYLRNYLKNWYQENRDKVLLKRKEQPEKIIEYSRNRRARKKKNGGRITTKEWKELCDKYGNKCLCCGRNDVKLTLDHVIPLKLGGKHIIENAQPLCINCNCRKHAKEIDYR